MRGEYISKAECQLHAGEIGRTMDAYPKAMAAMAEHERLMAACRCEFDGEYTEDGPQVRRIPAAGCPVHADSEDEE